MRYETLMFTKTQLDYYRLFEKLCKLPKKSYLIREIATLTDLSYAKVKYGLERISEILEYINPNEAQLFSQPKKLNLEKFTISLTEFRFTLLQHQSVPFQFLLWLLKEPQPNIEGFLKTHFISQSTLTRNVRPLQKYLKTYGIQLSLVNGTLEGQNELLLRQSLIYLFWMGTKGNLDLFKPYEIDESLLPKLLQQVPIEHHYINEKLFRLRLIIQHFRLKQKAYLPENPRLTQLFSETPAFDLTLCQKNPLIPQEAAAAESMGLWASTILSPNFAEEDSALLVDRKTFLQGKVPDLFSLADNFLKYFESHYFPQEIPCEKRNVLQINLTQAACGIWVYQGTFPNLHYFLVQEEQVNEANLRYAEQVHQFFVKITEPAFLAYQAFFPVFEKSFGHILRPYYVANMTWTKLSVGIVTEPNSLLYDKLMLVMASMYFVEAQIFRVDQAEKYDLVVISTANFHEDYPDIPYYLWNIAGKDEDLPYIYYWLRDHYYQKNQRLRFI